MLVSSDVRLERMHRVVCCVLRLAELLHVWIHHSDMRFQQVVEEKETRRNRLHLDLGVDDLDGATARVIELGGLQVEEHQAGDFTWRVMQDPGGNEFCLAPHG